MEADGFSASKHHPPNFITLSPFSPIVSPSPRRLSSCFTEQSRPVRAARQLAWVSLQGRLVGAEEASSAKTIASGNRVLLSPKEAVSWELFSPIHRILIVAVISVATAISKRNRQIFQLKKAVELRDQVLSVMQEKLDNLCEQVKYFKDQPEAINLVRNWNGDQVSKYKCPPPPISEAEQPEERRMSDLSDWAPSVTSSVDVQLNTLAIEQDIHNLRRECEEKDVTIKELSNFIHSAQVFGSKRTAELEDVIRRKNMTITKLKKDMLVLEQKVVNLTRTRRPSFSGVISNERQLPVMADNLLYDMDNSTSSSSSDSDSSPGNPPQFPSTISGETPVQKSHSALTSAEGRETLVQKSRSALPGLSKVEHPKGSILLAKPRNHHQKPQPVSPLKEHSLNQVVKTDSESKQNATFSVHEHPKSRRQALARSRDTFIQKRWN
ncbi:hypothetical protein ACH5RR_021807 [Cinchona calisaya]|uniref:Uncharacterized protein n=1 Tax=Cinchona calisaya TaxID=153742 RepID=A0ABD2ZJN2_9GENT